MKLKKVILAGIIVAGFALCGCSLLPGGSDDDTGTVDLFGDGIDGQDGQTNITGQGNDNNTEGNNGDSINNESSELKILYDERHIMKVENSQISVIYETENEDIVINSVCFDDDEVFFNTRPDDKYEDTKLYHITPEGQVEFITDITYASFFDIYYNELYVFYYTYDDEYEAEKNCIKFSREANGKYSSSKMDDEFMLDALEDNYGRNYSISTYRSLDKYNKYYKASGEALTIYGYDSDGRVIESYPVDVEQVYSLVFNGENLIFNGGSYGSEKFYFLDTTTGEIKRIFEDASYVSYIVDYVENYILYVKYINTDTTDSVAALYCYDINTGNDVFLSAKEDLPGTNSFLYRNNYNTSTRYYDGIIYYVDTTTQGQIWRSYNLKTGENKDTGLWAYESSMAKIGKTYVKEGHTDYDNGDPIYTYHVEGFEVTANIPGKNKINESLTNLYNGWITEADRGDEVLANYDESYGEYYSESSETYVDSVFMLGDKYLCVYYTGYDYYGGAHGFPFRIFSIYDTESGEELGLKDICSCSEEEFKKLVAEASYDLYENTTDYFYTTMDNPENMYTEFYNNASFDMSYRLNNSEIIIMYSPYEYGPYSSGYIEVAIPFEDAGVSVK